MPSQRRFNTQEDCRRSIAWIFRELEHEKMKHDKARVLIYAAKTISEILSEHDLEERIAALEARLAAGEGGPGAPHDERTGI